MRACKAAKAYNSMAGSFKDVMDQVSAIGINKDKLVAQIKRKRMQCRTAKQVWQGNPWIKRIPVPWCLQHSFKGVISPGISKSSLKIMRIITSLTIMALQLKFLAKVALCAHQNRALCTWTRTKRDEASNSMRVLVSSDRLNNNYRDAVWSVMVCKITLLVCWADKQIQYHVVNILVAKFVVVSGLLAFLDAFE